MAETVSNTSPLLCLRRVLALAGEGRSGASRGNLIAPGLSGTMEWRISAGESDVAYNRADAARLRGCGSGAGNLPSGQRGE